MRPIKSFLASLFLLALLPGFASAMESPTAGGEQSSELSQPSETLPLSESVLPLQQPLTIEGSLTELESLLDSWESDSMELSGKLLELRTTVEELKSTLTRSERLAEGLALSLEQERSKTRSLRRWLVISISGGVVVGIVAFCLGAYSSP